MTPLLAIVATEQSILAATVFVLGAIALILIVWEHFTILVRRIFLDVEKGLAALRKSRKAKRRAKRRRIANRNRQALNIPRGDAPALSGAVGAPKPGDRPLKPARAHSTIVL